MPELPHFTPISRQSLHLTYLTAYLYISPIIELMNYRKLGNSGLMVPEITIGTWLTLMQASSIEEARKLIHTALNAGIWLIDTADMYNRGGAEERLGECLKDIPRSNYLIATKVFGPMSDHPMDKGLSRRHVMNAVEGSLKRLRTDYIDVYQCHRYDASTPLEEVCRTFDGLIQQGKIRYWGVSQWSAIQIQKAIHICQLNHWALPISNQPIYNMLNRSLEIEVMEVCEEAGLGLLVYSPLAQGLLTGKYQKGLIPEDSRAGVAETSSNFPFKRMTDENFEKLERLKAIAQDHKITLPVLALAWCLRKTIVSSVIIGASRPEQILQNAQASGLNLPDTLWNEIEEILQNHPVDQYTGNRIGHGVSKGGY